MSIIGAPEPAVLKPAGSAYRLPAVLVRVSVWLLYLIVAVWASIGLAVQAQRVLLDLVETTPPAAAGVDVYRLFVDDTPVPLTLSVGWEKVPFLATYDAVRSDHTLWRRMQFEDWDKIPSPLRNQALDAMFNRQRHLLSDPAVWDRMTAHDWDPVPQPIRALAFRHMTQYWSGYYAVGVPYDIPRGLMADTLAAIVMSESWFDHRAVNVNESGSRDFGVAQASDFARARMAQLYRDGRVDVLLEDQDYFDPWKATRFAAIWMNFILDDVRGDLNAAIRAYNRGPHAALRGHGEEYLEAVLRRRQRFIRNVDSPPSWNYLWHRDRELIDRAWPWLGLGPVSSLPAFTSTVPESTGVPDCTDEAAPAAFDTALVLDDPR